MAGSDSSPDEMARFVFRVLAGFCGLYAIACIYVFVS